MKDEMVSLATLAQGAALERFDDELAKVLENIMDPNTMAEKEREIVLKVKIKPNEARDFCQVRLECSSRTAAAKTFETHIYVGWDKVNGTVKATEYNPQQTTMTFQPHQSEKVTPMVKAGGKND
jgi:hypothetical protein